MESSFENRLNALKAELQAEGTIVVIRTLADYREETRLLDEAPCSAVNVTCIIISDKNLIGERRILSVVDI
jgi:hypothetical protein